MINNKRYWLRGALVGLLFFIVIFLLAVQFNEIFGPIAFVTMILPLASIDYLLSTPFNITHVLGISEGHGLFNPNFFGYAVIVILHIILGMLLGIIYGIIKKIISK